MGMNSGLLNVRLPPKIVDWLDNLVDQGIYKSRSEAIRDFIRSAIREEAK
jgi:Arc/MetJ-type ribon-helix-helix transcriptional regulator